MAILRKLCFVADFFGQLALRLKLWWTVQVYFEWVYFATYFAMVYFPTLSFLLIILNKLWVPLKCNCKSGAETFSKSKAKVRIQSKYEVYFFKSKSLYRVGRFWPDLCYLRWWMDNPSDFRDKLDLSFSSKNH